MFESLNKVMLMGYSVKFNPDFVGMLRIDYSNELCESFYEHSHVGFPDCPIEKLDELIRADLEAFIKRRISCDI